jgi:16S rRNA (guanine966-N2)-methyltransferase
MAAKSNQVRIIAGQWRGRKLEFPASQGLRPTSDRVRETLFNWLAPVLPGAVCLDLFAGSGALGFEAASRGAARVVMVEQDSVVFHHLQSQSNRLSAQAVELVNANANDYLAGIDTAFDIMFLDPPFGGAELRQSVIQHINQRQLVKPGGLIYLETGKGDTVPELPENWQAYRHKQAGQVDYQLLSYTADKYPG